MQASSACSDVITFRVGQQLFKCCKNDLTKRSEYFSAMFTHGFSETNQTEILLKDVDECAFKFIVYKGTFNSSIGFDLAMNILKVSSMLQFDKETDDCDKFIISSNLISVKPLQVMSVTNQLSRTHLFKRSLAYCLWNFSKLKDSDDFLNLPVADLSYYIDDIFLRTEDEMEVFVAIKRWIYRNNPDDSFIIILMKSLRFKSLTSDDMNEIISTLFVQKNNFLKNILDTWLQYASHKKYLGYRACSESSDGESNDECSFEFTEDFSHFLKELECKEARRYPANPCIVIHQNDTYPTIYDFSGDELKIIIELNKKPCTKIFVGFRVILFDYKMFLFGGEEKLGSGNFNTGVWQYNFISETFTYENHFLEKRRHFFITSLDDWVFLIGGTGKHRKILCDIEKYNVITKERLVCRSHKFLRNVEAVCSYGNKIYIACQKLHVYDPYNDSLQVASVELPRIGVSFIAVRNNYLYAVDRDGASIFQWNLTESTGSHEDIAPTRVGFFSQLGYELLISNYIYHISCSDEPDCKVLVEKFCLDNLTKSVKEISADIGEFYGKHVGCLPLPCNCR